MNKIAEFIKTERKKAGLTQEEFALRSGLGLRFVRELEQGKETVRLDKVNQALRLLGIVERNWKIDGKDRFALLLTACNDCIGDVRVEALFAACRQTGYPGKSCKTTDCTNAVLSGYFYKRCHHFLHFR